MLESSLHTDKNNKANNIMSFKIIRHNNSDVFG